MVYHPLFSELEMGEVDVKYHQFSYLVNSPDELAIENFLVYQNYTGTCKIVCLSFCVFSSHAGFFNESH